MTLDDLPDVIAGHRAHGPLTVDATEPSEHGYLLTVGCACGVTFMRRITEADVGLRLDVVIAARGA